MRKTRGDYYTEAIDYTRLKILERFDAQVGPQMECAHGEVHVVTRVKGYKKIRYYTHENVGYGEIDLPDYEMHTTALWWCLAPSVLDELFSEQSVALDGLNGAAYALHHVAALLSMAELPDLGRSVGTGQGEEWPVASRPGAIGRADSLLDTKRHSMSEPTRRFEPAIFLYDSFPGGMGLSAPLYGQRDELVAHTRELVVACECTIGCPACVGPVLQNGERRSYSLKQAVLDVLSVLNTNHDADIAPNTRLSDPASVWQ